MSDTDDTDDVSDILEEIVDDVLSEPRLKLLLSELLE